MFPQVSRLLDRQVGRRSLLRSAVGLAGAVSFASIVIACETQTADEDEPDAATTDDQAVDAPSDEEDIPDEVVESLPEGFEPPDIAELNLETREAAFASETVKAEPYENTYVGEVTEDLFVAVSLDSRYTDQAGELTVYLCDNELSVYLSGELDENNEAVLADDQAEIEIAITDDEISGSVTLSGEDPIPFTAVEASGDAGLYAAELDVDGVEIVPRWIVLSDGRQRGNNICCATHPRTGQRVCYPCWSLH